MDGIIKGLLMVAGIVLVVCGMYFLLLHAPLILAIIILVIMIWFVTTCK